MKGGDFISIVELAENYGSLDLLTAYIMRTASVSEERADELAYIVDMGFERWLEIKMYSERDEEEQ